MNVSEAKIAKNEVSYSGSAGIGCFRNSSCDIKGNVVNGNGQWAHTTLPVGIAFRGAHRRVRLTSNVVRDDQSPRTQMFAVYATDDTSFDDLTIERNNRLKDNGIGALGGKLDTGAREPGYRRGGIGR